MDWATDNHLLYLDGLYMNYTLRPYQQEASDIAVRLLKNSDKPFVIQAATGAGKSLIIADICHKLDAPVLILQPSKEILEQIYEGRFSYKSIPGEAADLIKKML